jgi:hypothetical protein
MAKGRARPKPHATPERNDRKPPVGAKSSRKSDACSQTAKAMAPATRVQKRWMRAE